MLTRQGLSRRAARPTDADGARRQCQIDKLTGRCRFLDNERAQYCGPARRQGLCRDCVCLTLERTRRRNRATRDGRWHRVRGRGVRRGPQNERYRPNRHARKTGTAHGAQPTLQGAGRADLRAREVTKASRNVSSNAANGPGWRGTITSSDAPPHSAALASGAPPDRVIGPNQGRVEVEVRILNKDVGFGHEGPRAPGQLEGSLDAYGTGCGSIRGSAGCRA